jgi:hypothetical protein
MVPRYYCNADSISAPVSALGNNQIAFGTKSRTCLPFDSR